ncbi:MAG: ferritin [Desulfuromonadales bacterium]|nr:ferritin [Desulfuromonadales bacterium]NIR33138.1 ferritin [Desulfuromonadales bacterium]NIS43140.1 ferritin [Desulfuromonadales bacterium]
MNVYKCLICGDPYVGTDKPTNCPFCGAHQRHIVTAEEYAPEVLGELTETSRKNLERALELEVGNSAFYRGASKVADSVGGQALFSALAKVEAEHASVLCKMLGREKPEELYEIGECSPAHNENLAESHKREERAIHLYGRFLEEAKEPRVQQVLEAFIEIEKDHLSFSG